MYVRQHIGVLLCLYSPLHLLDSDFWSEIGVRHGSLRTAVMLKRRLWCLRVCCLSLILLLHT